MGGGGGGLPVATIGGGVGGGGTVNRVSTGTGCSMAVVFGIDAGGREASCVGFGVVVLGIMGSGVRFGVGLEVRSISIATGSASPAVSVYSSPSKVSRYFSGVSAATST